MEDIAIIIENIADLTNSISADTIFTVIVSLSVFIVGILLKWGYDWYKERNSLSVLQKYYLSSLSSLIPPLLKRIGNLRLNSREIKSEESRVVYYHHEVGLFMGQLQNLDSTDLFKIFVQRKRRKRRDNTLHYRNIQHAIEFIETQKKVVEKDVNDFVSKTNRHVDKWLHNTNGIFRLFDEYKSHNMRNKIPPSQDLFLKGMDRLIFAWTKKKDRVRYNIMIKRLIEPLMRLCNKYIDDERVTQIIPKIVEAKRSAEHIVNVREVYFKQFRDHAMNHIRWCRILCEAINYFS